MMDELPFVSCFIAFLFNICGTKTSWKTVSGLTRSDNLTDTAFSDLLNILISADTLVLQQPWDAAL